MSGPLEIEVPLFLYPSSSHHSQGAYPDKAEWFHCTSVHIIMNERLTIPEAYY
jgi:hypothetical protein